MAVNALTRVTVTVADLDRSLALYSKALGIDILYRQDERAMLTLPGGTELQLHVRPPEASKFGVTMSLGVPDVDAATEDAVAAGATLLHGPADQPWGERQTVLSDPDGHTLCLVTPLR